ncbi:metal ABC transporter substrate-binding protein [Saccharibacillus qingshengii]|uniref:metal ABC transporter substrate-binding protein n=1 Tax=Saccharibacillus qingshengii TaxID=1763540 RepID=UPI001FE67AEA|nr:metal ABC transporter substrate-binding protein [Saccharibacillus qingshengii]
MKRKYGTMTYTAGASLLSLMLILGGCGSNAAAPQKSGTAAEGSSAAGTSAEQAPADKLQVEASFYPMYEFARQVGGDLADVKLLVPSGTEPHDWEPTPQDIARIQEADMLVYNGSGMESWVEQVLGATSNTELLAVEASKDIDKMEASEEDGHDHGHEEADTAEEGHDHDAAAEEEHDHAHEGESEEAHDHGGLDPHVWLSPRLAVQEVRAIEAAFAKADLDHADQYKSNADAYAAKLEALDSEFKEGLSGTKRTDFITQHAAFGYLARDYGLTQVPIAGLSPDQEPAAGEMSEVVEFAKEHDVKTIFFETLVSSKVAETIASEVGAETSVLNPLEGLTEEEMAAGDDYLSVMRANLEALRTALNQ